MPTEFLRGVIGILGAACAFMTGRMAVAVWKGRVKSARLTGWVLRTVLCMVAVGFRHPLDRADLLVWALAAAAFAAGCRTVLHEKPPEDLTHQIFPDDQT